MGLFGGGNSSSSTTTTSQSSGFSQITGPALALQGTGNQITFTDQGALKVAENIAGEALSSAQLAGQNQTNAFTQAISAIQQASQGQAQSIALTAIKWGGLALLAYFAFRLVAKK